MDRHCGRHPSLMMPTRHRHSAYGCLTSHHHAIQPSRCLRMLLHRARGRSMIPIPRSITHGPSPMVHRPQQKSLAALQNPRSFALRYLSSLITSSRHRNRPRISLPKSQITLCKRLIGRGLRVCVCHRQPPHHHHRHPPPKNHLCHPTTIQLDCFSLCLCSFVVFRPRNTLQISAFQNTCGCARAPPDP